MLVGVDVLDVARMEDLVKSENFLNKYFTDYEVEYVKNKPHPAQSLAGIFATKEAFLKALGIGIGGGIDLKEIEVNHYKSGKPYLILNSIKAQEKLDEFNVSAIDVSISHTASVCTSICVLKGGEIV